MKEKLEFNLTHTMAIELIKFNDLKKEYNNLINNKILTKEDLIRKQTLENELNKAKINFIKDFRKNNKEEIIKYLNQKDQKNWSFFVFKRKFKFYLE